MNPTFATPVASIDRSEGAAHDRGMELLAPLLGFVLDPVVLAGAVLLSLFLLSGLAGRVSEAVERLVPPRTARSRVLPQPGSSASSAPYPDTASPSVTPSWLKPSLIRPLRRSDATSSIGRHATRAASLASEGSPRWSASDAA